MNLKRQGRHPRIGPIQQTQSWCAIKVLARLFTTQLESNCKLIQGEGHGVLGMWTVCGERLRKAES